MASKRNPWLHLNAVVTMFDSGGSSGQLRDELGVLPPGDVLKCALALARNEGEARRVLLARLPTLEQHDRLAGHTGGNLLLSMMEQYSGDFLAAVDGASQPARLPRPRLAGERRAGIARGRVRRRHASRAARSRSMRGSRAAIRYASCGSSRRCRSIPRLPKRSAVSTPCIIGPGSFFTSLMPPLLVRGVKEALADVRGPIILIANLLTEGRGMSGFTAADAARWVSDAIGRPVDVVIANDGRPSEEAVTRYAAEHKEPLRTGNLDPAIELVHGAFWCTEIARHDRRRLAFAVWTVLSQRLLQEPNVTASASASLSS